MAGQEQFTDDQLLDVAEGGAEAALARRVELAAAANPALRGRLEAWRQMTSALAPARTAARASGARTLRQVRTRLDARPIDGPIALPEPSAWVAARVAVLGFFDGWSAPLRWGAAGAAGVVCLGVALLAGLRPMASAPPARPMRSADVRLLSERIDAARPHATVVVEDGRIAAPLRIDRPVRLAARNATPSSKPNKPIEGEKS